MFLDKERKPEKKENWRKNFEIFSPEIKAQLQPNLLSNMCALKQHPMYTSCSRKYFIYCNYQKKTRNFSHKSDSVIVDQ